MAFRDAIDAIREQLKGLSFTAFIDTYGSAELKSIFDSVGVKAAEDFLPNAGRYS